MAQDVEMIRPEAVVEMDGYKAVRYDMINVPFERNCVMPYSFGGNNYKQQNF